MSEGAPLVQDAASQKFVEQLSQADSGTEHMKLRKGSLYASYGTEHMKPQKGSRYVSCA